MPCATMLHQAYPVESVMRSGMILDPNDTPATPTELLPTAETMPATAVPCPWTSLVLLLLSEKFQPGTKFAARSGWEASTPLSKTAMITPEPVVAFHAVGAPIWVRCHSLGKY